MDAYNKQEVVTRMPRRKQNLRYFYLLGTRVTIPLVYLNFYLSQFQISSENIHTGACTIHRHARTRLFRLAACNSHSRLLFWHSRQLQIILKPLNMSLIILVVKPSGFQAKHTLVTE